MTTNLEELLPLVLGEVVQSSLVRSQRRHFVPQLFQQ